MSSSANSVGTGTATTHRGRSIPALLPTRLRTYHPPRWWVEITILVAFNVVYERLRNLVPTREGEAYNRGDQLFHFTQRIHWDVELSINHFVASHSVLAHVFNAYYTYLHLPITASVLLWMYVRHKRQYRAARSVLAITTIIGLVGFYLFPMAPPRLLPDGGFVDTLVHFSTWGSWSSHTVAAKTNQFAAMPSLHCAWALWVGLCVFNLAPHRWQKVLGLLYPLCTFLVVVGTANHFVLDGVAGAMVLGASFGIHRLLFGQRAYAPALTRDELVLAPPTGAREVA